MRDVVGRGLTGRVDASGCGCSLTIIAASRNDPCPCGSGRKYKRCCLVAAQEIERVARLEREVGGRIEEWAAQTLEEELERAREQFLDGRPRRFGDEAWIPDEEVELFSAWFHNDRRLSDGTTPAGRYALRSDLDSGERTIACRIASARLGVHRVVEVRAGEWLAVEPLGGGERTIVPIAHISGQASRWDLLVGRLIQGEPPSLWGPARLLAPSDEADLMAQLSRMAGRSGASPTAAAIAQALEADPLQLFRFRPGGWDEVPTFFTLEGDPAADARAVWRTADQAALERRMRTLGGLLSHEELVIDITVARDELIRNRAQLPQGAIVLESAVVGDLDSIPIATLRVDGDRLVLEAMSAERLHRAIEIVGGDFGDLLAQPELDLVPIERRMAERRALPPEDDVIADTGLDEETEGRLLEEFLTDRMRKWVDDPHPQLGGITPRQAARGSRRAEVVWLVQLLENGVDRARCRGEASADLSWLRDELGLHERLAA